MNQLKPSSARWRLFLRAMAEELNGALSAEQRDAMLRGIGGQMARLAPLPVATTLEDLEVEMNEVLAEIGWGATRLALNEASRRVEIVHTAFPAVGSRTEASGGPWLSATLAGLYTTWFAVQPGADSTLIARQGPPTSDGAITLTYGQRR